ncbi:hypothetical protein EDEG_00955 [Edhazardia aedis USNM 41457]|uniref:Uncharacterized protein n=1 Tax=Edhazardia aedis (strain USNM 41457) TaxID=1003232 RepID=J9DU86_EDHAE|nr:hypothetical protein EDEG_00955 [Edhazardia aedis USNM 41457]|eukprot:EJW04862.1 hypothetical protein EDEG_00955 [Edhazardia aedis USNM 41457]
MSFFKDNFYRCFEFLDYFAMFLQDFSAQRSLKGNENMFTAFTNIEKYFKISKNGKLRKDIEFIKTLVDSSKYNGKIKCEKDKNDTRSIIDIPEIFYKSKPVFCQKKLGPQYFKSFKTLNKHLLNTKTGTLFIYFNIKNITEDNLREILIENRKLNHEINTFIDKFIYTNNMNNLSFYPYYKGIYDDVLNSIILEKEVKIEFKDYIKYKDMANCALHLVKNEQIDVVVNNFRYDVDFSVKCIVLFLKKDFIHNFVKVYDRIKDKIYKNISDIDEIKNLKYLSKINDKNNLYDQKSDCSNHEKDNIFCNNLHEGSRNNMIDCIESWKKAYNKKYNSSYNGIKQNIADFFELNEEIVILIEGMLTLGSEENILKIFDMYKSDPIANFYLLKTILHTNYCKYGESFVKLYFYNCPIYVAREIQQIKSFIDCIVVKNTSEDGDKNCKNLRFKILLEYKNQTAFYTCFCQNNNKNQCIERESLNIFENESEKNKLKNNIFNINATNNNKTDENETKIDFKNKTENIPKNIFSGNIKKEDDDLKFTAANTKNKNMFIQTKNEVNFFGNPKKNSATSGLNKADLLQNRFKSLNIKIESVSSLHKNKNTIITPSFTNQNSSKNNFMRSNTISTNINQNIINNSNISKNMNLFNKNSPSFNIDTQINKNKSANTKENVTCAYKNENEIILSEIDKNMLFALAKEPCNLIKCANDAVFLIYIYNFREHFVFQLIKHILNYKNENTFIKSNVKNNEKIENFRHTSVSHEKKENNNNKLINNIDKNKAFNDDAINRNHNVIRKIDEISQTTENPVIISKKHMETDEMLININKTFETIFNNRGLSFSIKKMIVQNIESSFLIDKIKNRYGFFTKELYALTKTIKNSLKAMEILETTENQILKNDDLESTIEDYLQCIEKGVDQFDLCDMDNILSFKDTSYQNSRKINADAKKDENSKAKNDKRSSIYNKLNSIYLKSLQKPKMEDNPNQLLLKYLIKTITDKKSDSTTKTIEFLDFFISQNFTYHLDSIIQELLILKMNDILKDIKRNDMNFGKKVLKVVSNLCYIFSNNDFIKIDIINYIDNKFVDEVIDIYSKWIDYDMSILVNLSSLLENIAVSKVLVGVLIVLEKKDPLFVNTFCSILMNISATNTDTKNNDADATRLDNIIEINSNNDDNNNSNACNNINNPNNESIISKNILQTNNQVEMQNKLLLEVQKLQIHKNKKCLLNFLAYLPCLRFFKRHKNNFIPTLKENYKYNPDISIKAFSKIYNRDIESFVIDRAFIHNQKLEIMLLFEVVLKNLHSDDFVQIMNSQNNFKKVVNCDQDDNDIINTICKMKNTTDDQNNENLHSSNICRIFAVIFYLRFDSNDKVKNLALDLWVSNFKKGLIESIMPFLILFFILKNDNNERIFIFTLNEILEKYQDVLENYLNYIINEFIKVKNSQSSEYKQNYVYDDINENKMSNNINLSDKNDNSNISNNISTVNNTDTKNLSENLSFEFIKNGINEFLFSNRTEEMSKNFSDSFQSAIQDILYQSSQKNVLMDISFRYIQHFYSSNIINLLSSKRKFQNKIADLIVTNKMEYSYLLQNKDFVDQLFIKTIDLSLLPFLSDNLKMNILSNNVSNIDENNQNTPIAITNISNKPSKNKNTINNKINKKITNNFPKKNNPNKNINNNANFTNISNLSKISKDYSEETIVSSIFKNVIPSSQWEKFLTTVKPKYIKHYLKINPIDFGSLQTLYDIVFEYENEIDDLITPSTLIYIKKCVN